MNIHVYHHFANDQENGIIKKIFETVLYNQLKLNQMATTLDQVLQSVTEESTLDDSIIALLNGIKQQLADALSGATLPPAVQEKVDAIFTQAEANKAKVSEALQANTENPPA